MSLRLTVMLACCLLNFIGEAQPKTDTYLRDILYQSTYPILQQVVNDPMKYRCQIIYTEINRDKKNNPTFINYYFNYDPKLYFNPASIVKLPLAFLSLEKLKRLSKKNINKYSIIQFDSSYERQRSLYKDSTSIDGLPTIAHLIKRAFLISENDPYNRMYQFVGQQEINRNLHQKGYPETRITRQFMGFTPEQNRHTNAIRFIDKNGKLIYTQPAAYNSDSFDFSQKILLGKAHIDRNDSVIQEPFDFTMHNNMPLEDVQQLLQSVLFPKSVPAYQRFDFTKDDYAFLYKYLSQYPSETSYPKYDTSEFYDSYVKFFFRDSTHKMPQHVRVFNKVGWSYGFLTDVSYVVDFKNKVEFMLSSTLYVNSDDVLNDSKYEYNSVGYPFLNQLGQTIYKYELQRKLLYQPCLSEFKIKYDSRVINDKRPSLKDVDN
ncbi:MAG: serine hydrolase [Flavisolibacter sp.]